MRKTLKLSLNNYAVIPHSLRTTPAVNAATPAVSIELASLYHHYFLDSFGSLPPNPDPAQFEHIQFLLPTLDFRFQGSGLGTSTVVKQHRSNELGQALCRWFLHEHLNITYFAHMQHVLNRQLHRAFAGCRVERVSTGDAPDYFCAEDVNRVFLAEAKGRYGAISFKNKEFDEWRRQFSRVEFYDASGSMLSIKGHIVASRFATEHDTYRVQSTLFAEDPRSLGERSIDPDAARDLGGAVVSLHYSGVAEKLDQRLLASSLATGVALAEEILIQAVAWNIVTGPLQGRRFVGGYFGKGESVPRQRDQQGRVVFERRDPLRLDCPSATFFGLEESIFRQVVRMARIGSRANELPRTFLEIAPFYSGFSVLRDGTAIGPLDFFAPAEAITV